MRQCPNYLSVHPVVRSATHQNDTRNLVPVRITWEKHNASAHLIASLSRYLSLSPDVRQLNSPYYFNTQGFIKRSSNSNNNCILARKLCIRVEIRFQCRTIRFLRALYRKLMAFNSEI